MVICSSRLLAVMVCLVCLMGGTGLAADEAAIDLNSFEGLWHGNWGGGMRPDGVGMQPLEASMKIRGNRVEIHGFPDQGGITGTARVDKSAKRLWITPTVAKGAPRAIDIFFDFRFRLDSLTLTTESKKEVYLSRIGVTRTYMANVAVELVTAVGINDDGLLCIKTARTLPATQAEDTFYSEPDGQLKTKGAAIFLIDEKGSKTITVDEARKLIRKPTTVAIAYRPDDQAAKPSCDGSIPVSPDSKAAAATYARILRPGTLAFVLSERENRQPAMP